MRNLAICLTVVLLTAWLLYATPTESDQCQLTIELVDEATGTPLSGLVRVLDDNGKRIPLPELLSRGQGLPVDREIHDWSVLSKSTTVSVPRSRLKVTAFSGLETEFRTLSLDLTGRDASRVQLKLRRFYDAHKAGYRNANTHVHLQKITRKESDDYLVDVAKADALDVVFVSYLERAEADVHYTTNHYSREDLEQLSTKHVQFGNGEEHRHNFGAGGEGYGHVMLLDIPKLVYPVSIGPGISKTGTDGIPLRRGIEQARNMHGTVIWCHNAWGMEDIPNWLAGRLHANNIFDGGTHGSYRHSYYRYWDIGLPVPVSTGTDWFIYDFSRVYALTDGPATVKQWLEHLARGRCYITNGPLLEFQVNGQPLGSELKLPDEGTVTITAAARGRLDFRRLELVQNGKVVHKAETQREGGHYQRRINVKLEITEPCWLAVRTPPPSLPKEPDFAAKTPLNEYGRELFSHTSPIFVTLNNRRRFDRNIARELLDEMQTNHTFIKENGTFADKSERQLVLEVYDEGIALLKAKLQRAN